MSPRFALLLALFAPLTLACTCVIPSLPRQYYDPATVNFVRATVFSRSNAGIGLRFTLFVTQNFKGCDPVPKTITVDTPASSAACGTNLQLFRSYVLPVRAGPNPSLILCDFHKKYSDLTADEKSFLETREKCCGDDCVCASGDPPVNCFRQPCSPPETAPCAEATECRDNYCGPCLAEWFNADGFPACE